MAGRSRSYPAVGLGEAVELARKLYDKMGKAPNTGEGIVKILGYKGINGSSARRLSALRQYGLLDSRDGNMDALSQRSLTILLEPDGSAERATEICAAAREPAIFSELLDAFQDGLPTDEGLVSYLVRQEDFAHSGAEKLVAVLRNTMTLVDATPRRYSEHKDGDQTRTAAKERERTPPPPPGDKGVQGGHQMPSLRTEGAQPFDLPIPLSEGTATLRIPMPMSAESYDLLTEALTMTLKLYRPTITRPQEAPADGDGAEEDEG